MQRVTHQINHQADINNKNIKMVAQVFKHSTIQIQYISTTLKVKCKAKLIKTIQQAIWWSSRQRIARLRS